MRWLLTILSFLLLILSSCIKDKEFPLEPYIEFRSFTKVMIPPDTIGSQLIISIRFTDGDGDIGLYDNETEYPYDYNYFLDIYRLVKGTPQLIVFPDTTLTFNGRIPMINENGGEKPIEGVIEYSLDYLLLRSFLIRDTIAFDISIKDRALNRSNIIRTPYFIVE